MSDGMLGVTATETIEEFFARFDDYVAEVVACAGEDGITRAQLRRGLPTMSSKSDDALFRAVDRLVEDGRIGMELEVRPNTRGVACMQLVLRHA